MCRRVGLFPFGRDDLDDRDGVDGCRLDEYEVSVKKLGCVRRF